MRKKLNQPLSFKEFIYSSCSLDEETIQTLTLLAETHGTIKNDATIQRLLNDKNARISVSELSSVLRSIHQRSVSLARSGENVSSNEKLLIIMEQNVLNTAASAISAAVSARLQGSIDKLIKIASITRR
jgi:two-component sensor histidine kinase